MYIRRTTTSGRKAGKPYCTSRLVESERVDGKVKQRTVLNLAQPIIRWPLMPWN